MLLVGANEMTRSARSLWLCASVTALSATAARAEDLQDNTPPENIVVTGSRVVSTATKTDTPVMETPVSVQTITQQTLQDQQALALEDALHNVSSVSSVGGEGTQENIWVRGFLTTTTFHNGYRVDEYSTTGGGTTGAVSLANVQSIDVLKGPAALLYGQVEPGGIVNVVTKQPQDRFAGSLEQIVGSWSQSVTQVDLTGPLNDDRTFLYRLNASYDSSDSWREGVNARTRFVAPVLEWRISPQTTVSVEGEFRHSDLDADVGQLAAYDAATNSLVFPPKRRQILDNPTTYDTDFGELRLTHDFTADWSVNLHLVDRYTDVPASDGYYPDNMHQVDGVWYVDRGLSTIGNTNHSEAAILDFTGHFSTFGLRHTLLLGGDFYDEHFTFSLGGADYGVFSTTPLRDPSSPSGLVANPDNRIKLYQMNELYGVYLQDQVELPHDVFLLAGVRYQHFRTTNAFEAPLGTERVDGEPAHDEATMPRVGLLWRVEQWLSLYGSYTENFGANNGFDYQGHSLPAEGAHAYETGAKTEFAGGRLVAAAALYHITKNNVAVADLAHPDFQETIGQIVSRGVEFDVQGEIAPGWTVVANASYNDAYVSRSTPGSTYVEGNRLDNVPHYLANVWATYEFRRNALRGWRVGGGVYYHGSSENTQGGIPPVSIPAYTTVSAMLSRDFEIAGETLRFQLNVNNLFNEHYYDNLYIYAPGAYSYLSYGDPRQVMGSLKLLF